MASVDEIEAAPTDSPSPDNPPAAPASAIERLGGVLETFAHWVLSRPALIILIILLTPPFWFLVAVAGAPSSILALFHPPPSDPAYYPLVRVTELVADVSFIALTTIGTYLLTAVIIIYGLIMEAKRAVKLTRSREAALTSRIEGVFRTQLDLLGEGWSIAVDDKDVRDQLTKITSAIKTGVATTDSAHRVVLHSLLRGMAGRFDDVVKNLAKNGSFMDPEERRKLTEELFTSTSSYHVIFHGVRPLRSGIWRWHDDYLRFLERVVNEQKDRVTWTFADWVSVPQDEKSAAISEVQSLGIPCFLFSPSGTTGDVARTDFEAFLAHGPLIEVFSRDFPTIARQGLKNNALLTWKSTSLRTRTSGRAHSAWFPDSGVEPSDNEGVWAAENIDKLVRAGVIRDDSSKEFRILDKICQHRTLQPPS